MYVSMCVGKCTMRVRVDVGACSVCVCLLNVGVGEGGYSLVQYCEVLSYLRHC